MRLVETVVLVEGDWVDVEIDRLMVDEMVSVVRVDVVTGRLMLDEIVSVMRLVELRVLVVETVVSTGSLVDDLLVVGAAEELDDVDA